MMGPFTPTSWLALLRRVLCPEVPAVESVEGSSWHACERLRTRACEIAFNGTTQGGIDTQNVCFALHALKLILER